MKIDFYLNGKEIVHDIDPRRRLVEFLHDDLDQLSVRESCYRGFCGSCTVLIDDVASLSCLIPVPVIQGKAVTTFDGFRKTDDYRIIRSALEAFRCFPCEYCYPAKILSIHSLLLHSPHPQESEIIDMLNSHSCSCDLYIPLIKSVHMAAEMRSTSNG